MRLGLPRTHDSWLSKALSLGFNVPVDSAAEALVRIFPGASMKIEASCQEWVFTPLARAMKSGVSSLSSVKDLMPSHFFVSNRVEAPSNFFFSKDAVSKAFFSI